MSKKTLLKISNKLLNHDSIINAITTKGMKYVLTKKIRKALGFTY